MKKLSKGTGGEFSDYRNYGIGDEIKYIDWNIYARTNKLFSKVFHEEGNMDIHLLLDVSKSMDFGKQNKLRYAKNIIMMLAYIGITNNHNVQFSAFADKSFMTIPLGHNIDVFGHFLETLEELHPQGQTRLNQSILSYLHEQKPSGSLFIVSDFLDKDGHEQGLAHLAYSPIHVCCVQVLCEEEKDPKSNYTDQLQDIESNRLLDLNLTKDICQKYMNAFKRHIEQFKTSCLLQNILYLDLSTAFPIDQFMLNLVQQGICKRK
jgi:uncharacterized protein (DUF58 family)